MKIKKILYILCAVLTAGVCALAAEEATTKKKKKRKAKVEEAGALTDLITDSSIALQEEVELVGVVKPLFSKKSKDKTPRGYAIRSKEGKLLASVYKGKNQVIFEILEPFKEKHIKFKAKGQRAPKKNPKNKKPSQLIIADILTEPVIIE